MLQDALSNKVYGWGHVKTQRAALVLSEHLAGPSRERLLRRALCGLEVTLGLHQDTLRALKSLALLVPDKALLQKWRRAAEAFLGPCHQDTIQPLGLKGLFSQRSIRFALHFGPSGCRGRRHMTPRPHFCLCLAVPRDVG